MKILVITQKVDANDDVLGFFHGWLKELATEFEQITVICLCRGRYDLPANIRILSLGKETGVSRIGYLINFYKYIWQTRWEYKSIFVHMNDEYVILGGWLWRLLGKRIYLWRNHIKGSLRARIAVWFSHQVFSTSPYSFVVRYKKNHLMPAGIDTDLFRPDQLAIKKSNSVFYFGRISPVKKIDIFIEALASLKDNGVDFKGYIIGDPPIRDQVYLANLKNQANRHDLSAYLSFLSGVPYFQAPGVCHRYELAVNMTNSGSLDKTILEAMACGCLPIVSNLSFKDILPANLLFIENNAQDLAGKIKSALSLVPEDRDQLTESLRQYVEANHSLNALVAKLKIALEK